ncbi:M1 family aminopeptidase [Pontibacter oryzae]|uniref:Aminopeptidase N n=1 Tax=Pontibacter oryzae TaxID=2304593 RepID=A0A399S0D5_9BACT|nr:M1 family aminopeptidase [Pontibacter oryzae]RIJ36701.1 T9SS C-terminal target domain-containing protein [Pontibacter oryzae]
MHQQLLLTVFLGLLLQPSVTLAQSIDACAETRLQTNTRRAVVTPQHQQLMSKYDITFYKLELEIERDRTFINGKVTLQANAMQPLDVFAFELHPNMRIDSVFVNDQQVTNISRDDANAKIILSSPIAASSIVKAVIYYNGRTYTRQGGSIGYGFNTAVEPQWGNSVTWSLSEPYSAYEWWPTKQVLSDKADSVHVFVTTSAENKVGSNGTLTRVVDLPDGKRRHEWKSNYPIAYYLVSVAVSDYEEYTLTAHPTGAPAPIPIVNYVYRGGALEAYKEEIDYTPGLIEQFSEQFGLYPFYKEKYGHSMAPIGGGMEHQTMTTQSTFFFTITAHELAHQWFGDNVTCASWEDIWLNEGFASYAEFLALETFNIPAAYEWINGAHQQALSRPNGSLKVSDTTNVNRIFDSALSYKKGASVLHMLRFEINDDAIFFRGLQEYQQRFAGKTAYTSVFKKVMEEVSGLALDYFFEQWFEGEGYPVYTFEWKQEGSRLMLKSTQTPSGNTPFFASNLEFRLVLANGQDKYVRVRQEQPSQEFILDLPASLQALEPDPDSWLLMRVQDILENPELKFMKPAQPVLYPNPTYSQNITIANLTFSATEAAVYNAAGQKMRHYTFSPNLKPVLNTTGLSAGTYIISLTDGRQYYQTTFVKAGDTP